MTSYAPGFGLGPFGLSPFGAPAPPWEDEPPIVLHSSRRIDLTDGSIAYDADGNPLGMDDIGQRMVLAVRRAVLPELQGIAFDEEIQQEIRRVLAEAALISGEPADVTLHRPNSTRPIVVERTPNGCNVTIFYRNNIVGTETSIVLAR